MDFAGGLLHSLNIFLVLVLYCAACFGAGWTGIKLVTDRVGGMTNTSFGIAAASAFLLGEGLLAQVWLLLATAGWMRPWIVWTAVAGLATLGVSILATRSAGFWIQARSIWREAREEAPGWRVLYVMTLALALASPTALGRPISVDSAAFYLALPKVVAASHRLLPLPGANESFTSLGLLAEMHYAALLSMGSAAAARLFCLPTLFAGALALLGLGRLAGLGRRGQWIAAMIMLSSSAVILLMADGKTDYFAAALGLAALYWGARIWSGSSLLPARLTGLFVGFALIAKLTYLLTLLPAVAVLVVFAHRSTAPRDPLERRGAARWWAASSQLALMAAIAVMPHLIKNAALFDNPLAPFFQPSAWWLDQAWYPEHITRQILMTYPLALTFGDYWGQYGTLSPLVLAFLPLSVILPRAASPRMGMLLVISFAGLLGVFVWLAALPSVFAPRYMLASLLLLSIPAARAAEYISLAETPPRLISLCVLSAAFISLAGTSWAFQNVVFFPARTADYLAGRLDECDRELHYCTTMLRLNERATAGARLFTNSAQRYWLRPDLIQCLPTNAELQAYTALRTDEQRWDFIHRRGFHYVVWFDRPEYIVPLMEAPDRSRLPKWLSVTLEQSGPDTILHLVRSKAAPETEIVCREIAPSDWRPISPYFGSP